MATEFTVTLQDRPGTLGHLASVLGGAGINIDGIAGIPCGGQGIVHLVTADPDGTRRVLDNAGIHYTTREVLLVSIRNEPGALGQLALSMAEAGVNLQAGYITMSGQVVLDADNLDKAREVAGRLGAG